MASRKTTYSRSSGSWWTEKMMEVFQQAGIEPFLEEGLELVRKRRALEFSVAHGIISARVQEDKNLPVRVSVSMPVIKPSVWKEIANTLADSALFLAKILINDLPPELSEVFEAAEVSLLPNSPEDLTFTCDCPASPGACSHLAALYFLLNERLDRDPIALFTFRGRDELISELHRLRSTERPRSTAPAGMNFHHISYPPSPVLSSEMDAYWTSGAALKELTYTIRADELPASLLRRLDPLPLGDLQTEVELALEDAYARVARRAQALGLGL